MQDPRDNLTPKQVVVLTALLGGRSVENAAKEAKINPATVHRWLNDSAFKEAQRLGRRELAEQALGTLQMVTRTAVAVVAEILTDRTKPASVRLRAAQIVIESTTKWLELQDIVQRLEALEQAHAKKL